MDQNTLDGWKHAIIPASINAIINGWISWGHNSVHAPIALTVDSVASGATSAIGNAVMMATSLGLILSLINFAMERRATGGDKRPGPVKAAIAIAVKNALFLFGLFVAAGVVWQSIMGTVEVGAVAATALSAGIAFGVSIYLYFAVKADHASWAQRL